MSGTGGRGLKRSFSSCFDETVHGDHVSGVCAAQAYSLPLHEVQLNQAEPQEEEQSAMRTCSDSHTAHAQSAPIDAIDEATHVNACVLGRQPATPKSGRRPLAALDNGMRIDGKVSMTACRAITDDNFPSAAQPDIAASSNMPFASTDDVAPHGAAAAFLVKLRAVRAAIVGRRTGDAGPLRKLLRL